MIQLFADNIWNYKYPLATNCWYSVFSLDFKSPNEFAIFDGKAITWCYQEVIDWTEKSEYSFCSRQSVNYHFDTAENYNTEAPEYERMEKSDNRPPEDFRLPEGNFYHYTESLSKIPDRKSAFCKPEIPDDPADCIEKYRKCDQQKNRKYNLTGHR